MGVFEILGFQGLVYVLLVLGFVVIRQVWRNAEAKKEEIMRLVQDTAMAEMEASTTAAGFASASIASVSASFDLDSLPVSASQGYQCAVCYSPTTMRCSRCKAVRYWFVFLILRFFNACVCLKLTNAYGAIKLGTWKF